ncbi:MAG: response regulator [Spirochaetota bacterium]
MALILVVDDEPMVLETLGRMLEKSGHMVECAKDVETASAAMSMRPPEIIFVDLVMPGTGGLTFIMESLKEQRHVAVIAMSGRIPVGTDSMLGLRSTLGICAFLAKPFTSAELAVVLDKALKSLR